MVSCLNMVLTLTKKPFLAVSICTHMSICVHVGMPLKFGEIIISLKSARLLHLTPFPYH